MRLRRQRVVGSPIRHARVQIFAVHVPRKRPRLTHQPIDHVSIVDPVLALATQPLHRLHPLARIPHLDLVGADACFHALSPETRWHRVRILLYLDRAPLAHTHPLPLQRLQPLRRQRTQPRLLLGKLFLPTRVSPRHLRQHELPVFFLTREIPAATQQQRLLHRLLEMPMGRLHIAILMAAGRVGCLTLQAIMRQQRPILGRELVGLTIVVDCQRHPVRAMALRHGTQGPQRILQTGTQAGETLGKTQRHVLPVGMR
jgi:hypothetical protein